MSAALFQLGSLVDLVVYDKENATLNRVKEVRSAFLYREIPFNMIKSAIAQFIIEITRKSIREKEQNEPLFKFLYDRLTYLDKTNDQLTYFHLSFILQLPDYLGFSLQPTKLAQPYYLDIREGTFLNSYKDVTYQLNDLQSFWVNQLLSDQLPDIKSNQRKHLLEGILLYYKYHVDGFGELNSHRIFEEIFN